MKPVIDLRADLNAEDDEGRWWSLLDQASDRASVVPGAVMIAGTDRFWSVVRIEQVDDDGQVHFVEVPNTDPSAQQLLSGREVSST
jgi:hypothetical protein